MKPAAANPAGRLWRGFGWLGAALILANGLAMMLAPSFWYLATPGVPETGPLNVHFVRDIGAAYLAVVVAIVLLLRGLVTKRALIGVAAVFMVAHAGFHLVDTLMGHGAHGSGLALELVGVYLPGLLFLLPFLPRRLGNITPPLPASLIEAQIAKGEKRLGVKLDYMRKVAADAPHMLSRLGRVSELMGDGGLTHVPKPAAHIAMIGATQIEDCGECLQIHVNLARADQVPVALLRAALANDPAAMPADIAAAYRFGRAVAAHDGEADERRLELERMLGKAAVVELAYIVALVHFYPAFKRGIGVAQACSAVRIELAA